SEYCSCPPRLPTPAASHVAIASGASHTVRSPRWTSVRSYAGQLPTRYLVLYVGCPLDCIPRSCSTGCYDNQGIDGYPPKAGSVHQRQLSRRTPSGFTESSNLFRSGFNGSYG